MARIPIINATATRRRSSSDLFMENGIWILKKHLAEKGHTVEPLDLATHRFYREINPIVISRILRKIYGFTFTRKNSFWSKLLNPAAGLLQGLSARIRKQRMHSKLKHIAGELDPDTRVFGIKVWYGEAFLWAKHLCNLVHRFHPECIVIAGGYHPTLYGKDFMDMSRFDAVVTGEGETPLQIILDTVDENKKNWNKETVLNTLAEKVNNRTLPNTMIRKPDHSLVLSERTHPTEILHKEVPQYRFDGDEKMRVHILSDSVGCAWGKCSFCVHSSFYQEMIPKKVKCIVDEIESVREQGIGMFRFAGSDTYPSFGVRIAREILKRGLNIRYSIGARATRHAAHPEVFETLISQYTAMIRAGLRAVFMGGETGNAWVNEHVMNKGITPEDIRWSIRALRKAEQAAGEKVYISLAYIYPVPTMGEVSRDRVFEDNLTLVRESRPDAVMVTPPVPFKQSDWYRERERYGFNLADDFFRQLMTYEYVVYKPVHMWEELELGLEDMDFKQLMAECGRMKQAIRDLGIDTDVSDEHYLMEIAAGYTKNRKEFAFQSMLDIISGDYRFLESVNVRINRYSRGLAVDRKADEFLSTNIYAAVNK